ncbi:MAG: hypothetical protein HY079_09070 [Elusimicrobia bacterium]|nr:hypothetical protein [Elusimicrobiota bacterium]
MEADWRQPGGMRPFLRAPEVGLGAPSVNSHVELVVPPGRWTLFVGGRGVGPVVLFWSMLAVFALAALGLAKSGATPLDWRRWLLLAVGLSQLGVAGAALVAGWFVAMSERGRRAPEDRRAFNLVQVGLGIYTLFAASLLFKAIAHGLLGAPDMQIAGNGSNSGLLRWYLDRGGDATPRPWAVSVPLGAYRAAMLLWALWLADSVLDWARWAWSKYGSGGLWRKG